MAMDPNTYGYAISRNYLHEEILDKFPDHRIKIILASKVEYNKIISKPMNMFKRELFKQRNRKNKSGKSVRLILKKEMPLDYL